MSMTGVFGGPGVGKSSLVTSFIRDIYSKLGNDILRNCADRIFSVNEKYGRNLTVPQRVPIFTDYKVKFLSSIIIVVFATILYFAIPFIVSIITDLGGLDFLHLFD